MIANVIHSMFIIVNTIDVYSDIRNNLQWLHTCTAAAKKNCFELASEVSIKDNLCLPLVIP